SKTYTATAQTNTFTTTGLRGSDTVTSVNGLGNGTNVGTYDDSLSGATGTGLSNYAINYVNSALTIDPARLTVTGDTKDSAYTAIAQTNTYTTNGLLGSDTVTGVTGLATGTDVGTYDDTLSNAQGTGLSNYAINYVNGALTITPAAPPPTPPAPASSGGRSGGGSGSGIAVAAVGAGIAGLIVAIETSPGGWALETPTTLTADTGAAAVGDATLDYVAINEAGTEATVRLHTDKGIIKRTLPLKDGGDGTKHFGISDPNTGEYAELSFKHTTREYFYQESGALNGQAYAVKAHGWLRAGAA
ncbi:MAG: hypothetical protein LBV44_09255, partial [Methylobacillus sp.]|nr:hypothetical protein [Methylobacillus sp.]